MKIDKIKEELLREDKEFRKEYFKEDLAFGISNLISSLRAYENIDQKKLAKLINTKQSGISRLERGNSLPSLTLVSKIAKVLNYKIIIKFISKKTGMIFDSEGNISQKGYFEISNNITPRVTNSSSLVASSNYYPDLVLSSIV